MSLTYTYPVSFLSKCHRKEPQRRSCGSNILPQRSSCAFIMQPQRSSCGFQNSSSSDPQSAARRTSSCGRKKKFLRVHYFWAVLYMFNLLLAVISSRNKMAIERFSLNEKYRHFIFSFSQIFR